MSRPLTLSLLVKVGRGGRSRGIGDGRILVGCVEKHADLLLRVGKALAQALQELHAPGVALERLLKLEVSSGSSRAYDLLELDGRSSLKLRSSTFLVSLVASSAIFVSLPREQAACLYCSWYQGTL